MGLIKALTSSTSSVLGDQFKEYITCPTMTDGVLMVRGIVNHGQGSKNFSDDIITNGSAIVVPEGVAMIVVENGKILDLCAEAGTYTFNSGSEPSIFTGSLGKGISDSFKKIASRITFGGQTANTQRVYYVNLLTLVGNKFGSAQPKKITDEKYGVLEITFFGEYAIKVDNPLLLISNILGSNARDKVLFSDILGSQFKVKFAEKLAQSIAVVMRNKKVSFGDIQLYLSDLTVEMNKLLDDDLVSKYGIKITDITIGDINITEESMKRVSKIDDAIKFSDIKLQSGLLANASAEAMVDAANNDKGVAVGVMGMNMVGNAGSSILSSVNDKREDIASSASKSESGNRFCSNCGKGIDDKMNYCPSCGHKLK